MGSLEILMGEGVSKSKHLRENMKLTWNFQRGGGEGLSQEPFMGGVRILSRTTKWKIIFMFIDSSKGTASVNTLRF